MEGKIKNTLKKWFSQKYKNENDVKAAIKAIINEFTEEELKVWELTNLKGQTFSLEEAIWAENKSSTVIFGLEEIEWKSMSLKVELKNKKFHQKEVVDYFSSIFDPSCQNPELILSHKIKKYFIKIFNLTAILVSFGSAIFGIWKNIFG